MAPNGDFCQVRPIGLSKDNAPPPPPLQNPSRASPKKAVRCLFDRVNSEEVDRLMEEENKMHIERLKKFRVIEVLAVDIETDGSKRAKTEKPNLIAETIAIEKSEDKRKTPVRTPKAKQQNNNQTTMTGFYPSTKFVQKSSKAEVIKSITNAAGICHITKTPTSTKRDLNENNDDSHFARNSTSS